MVAVSSRPLDASVVATAVPVGPVGTAAPESAISALMNPDPVPYVVSRTETPLGAVQAVVAEDLSAQYLITQLPAAVTEAAGAVCVVPAPAPAVCALEAGPAPEYAIRWTSTLVLLFSVTVTDDDASDAVAVRCQMVVSTVDEAC
jgi:hypothetical protein